MPTAAKVKKGEASGHPPKELLTRYFTKVKLKNVKTFASEVELNLCHPNGQIAQWTVLLGENGTGKTTLLQYIGSTQPELSSLTPNVKIRPVALNPSWLDWHAENMNMSRPWPREGHEMRVSLNLSIPSTKLDSRLTTYQDINSEQLLTYELSFKTNENKPLVEGHYGMPTYSAFVDEFFLCAYGANRHVAILPEGINLNDPTQGPLATMYNENHPLVSPEQWLLGLDHLSKEDTYSNTLLIRAIDCLTRILPEISEISVEPFVAARKREMALVFTTTYGKVRFKSLSLGYRTMAAWIIDLFRRMAARYPHLENPAMGAAVVLIDEFDLHMHPQWQMHAMDHLSKQFPNVQFIVTAHSPLIVQAADGKANIVLLRKVKGGEGRATVEIENNPVHIKGWRIDQLITSDLFGIRSSRSPKYDKLVRRRIELLKLEKPTTDELSELEKITDQLDREAPPGISSSNKWLEKQLKSIGKRAK